MFQIYNNWAYRTVCSLIINDGTGQKKRFDYNRFCAILWARVIFTIKWKTVRAQTKQENQRVWLVKSVTCDENMPNPFKYFAKYEVSVSGWFLLFCFFFVLAALIRRKWKEIPIQIIYEDQSTNDFNSLFKRVYGELKTAKQMEKWQTRLEMFLNHCSYTH